MVALLTAEKQRIIATKGAVTLADFDAAWHQSWETMRAEHAWPHLTQKRRDWRAAMIATRSEVRAAWLGQPTAFVFVVEHLSDVAGARLDPDRIPAAVLAFLEFNAARDHAGAA